MSAKQIPVRMNEFEHNELLKLMKDELHESTMNKAITRLIRERSRLAKSERELGQENAELHREINRLKVVIKRWTSTNEELHSLISD